MTQTIVSRLTMHKLTSALQQALLNFFPCIEQSILSLIGFKYVVMMPCMVPSIPRKKVASEKSRSCPCLSVPEYSYVFREYVSKDQNKKKGHPIQDEKDQF